MNLRLASIIVVAALSLTIGCSKEVCDISQPLQKTSTSSFKIGIDDVVSYIEKYKQTETKSNLNLNNIIPIVSNDDTLMFLVNYKDGWEVLSTDTRFPKVLAFSRGGNTCISELYDNQTSSLFFTEMQNALRVARHDTTSIFQSQQSRANWSDIKLRVRDGEWWSEWCTYRSVLIQRDTIEIDHLLDTHWGQSGVWATFMPYREPAHSSHCYAGCTMVATAQVLYYLHYKLGVPSYTFNYASCSAHLSAPTSSLTLNSSNTHFFSISELCWDNMAKNLAESSTKNYWSVSALMLRLGYLDGATYEYDGTSGSIPGMKNVLASHYGIDCLHTTSIAFDTIFHQIWVKRKPCILNIWDSNEYNTGHAIVVDGYHRDRSRYLKYQVRNNNYGEVQYRTIEEDEDTHYVAINWGYNGSGDYDSSGSTIWYLAMPSIYNNYINWSYTSGATTYHIIYSMLYNFSVL